MDIAGAHDRVSPAERGGIIAVGCTADMAINFPLWILAKRTSAGLGWPSMREDAYEQTVADSYMRAHYVSIKKALKRGVFRKSVTWWPAYAKYINEAFREIVVGGAPAEETLTKYKEKLEDEKSAYR